MKLFSIALVSACAALFGGCAGRANHDLSMAEAKTPTGSEFNNPFAGLTDGNFYDATVNVSAGGCGTIASGAAAGYNGAGSVRPFQVPHYAADIGIERCLFLCQSPTQTKSVR
jgi:hypothetical protein